MDTQKPEKKIYTPEELAKIKEEGKRLEEAEERNNQQTNLIAGNTIPEKKDFLPKGVVYYPGRRIQMGESSVPIPGKIVIKFYIWNTDRKCDDSFSIEKTVLKVKKAPVAGGFTMTESMSGVNEDDDLTPEMLKDAIFRAKLTARSVIEGKLPYQGQKLRMEGEAR